jgi:broad specificity phosphatase PhoE
MRHGRAKNNDIPDVGDEIIVDAPLTDIGRIQLQRLYEGGRLEQYRRFIKFSSSMLRARQTARILFPGENVVEDPAFNEIDTSLHEKYRYHIPDSVLREHRYESSYGESILEFCARCIGRIGRVMEQHDNVVIITHAGVLNAIFHHYTGIAFSAFPVLHIENGCGVEFSLEEGRLAKMSFLS